MLKSMQEDLFQCSFCSEFYDLELHLPKFLISCPHCLCLKCLNIFFINYPPHRLRCPSCKVSFPSTMKTPNDFPTNPTLFQLLQSRPKTKIKKETGQNKKPMKNEHKELSQDNVRKKLKTEQEIDGELGNLQGLITSQFSEMKKMIHSSQNIEKPLKADTSESTIAERHHDGSVILIKEEHNDDDDDDDVIEVTSKLKGIFTEAQETLNKFLKRSRLLKAEPAQEVPQFSRENEEEHINIPLKTNTFNIFQGHDYGNYQVFTPSKASDDEMEEEFDKKNQRRKKEIQEIKKQVMKRKIESQLKLDFSEKDISEEIFNSLCSENFWKKIDKNKISHLEVDFSESSLTDLKFIKFVQNIMIQLESLTSIVLNLAETKISQESIQVLSKQYLKNYKLRSFKLNCSQTSIGDEGIKNIDDGLSWSVQTLENIEIILDSTNIQGEKFLDVLMGMNQLKHLKLSFENSQISSEVISSVVFCLSFLAQDLESLDLNFNGTEIDDENLESFGNHTISQMGKLTSLKLSLGETFISNDFLLDFFQNLSSIANRIETLELDLHWTELSNTTFKQFCEESLSKMQNIERLKLDLSKTKITDISLKNLRIPAHKLKSLALNLNENKIQDLGLQSFKENHHFKIIKSINLQINQTDVSNEALQNFLNHVKKGRHTKTRAPLNEASPGSFSDTENHLEKESKPKKKRKYVATKFDVERKVYAELKQELVLHDGRKQDPSKLDTDRVSRSIRNLEPPVYDSIIIKILKRVLCISEVEAEKIEEWKKIIQTTIGTKLEMNSQKPKKEYRKRQKKNKNKNEGKQKNGNIEMDQIQVSTEEKSNLRNTEANQKILDIEGSQNHSIIEEEKKIIVRQKETNSDEDDDIFSEVIKKKQPNLKSYAL